MDVATLHIRNVPADLFEEIQRWAAEHGRSINAEIIDVIRREAERRQEQGVAARSLAAYFEQYGDRPVAVPDLVELIHEGRERDWFRDYGI